MKLIVNFNEKEWNWTGCNLQRVACSWSTMIARCACFYLYFRDCTKLTEQCLCILKQYEQPQYLFPLHIKKTNWFQYSNNLIYLTKLVKSILQNMSNFIIYNSPSIKRYNKEKCKIKHFFNFPLILRNLELFLTISQMNYSKIWINNKISQPCIMDFRIIR